MKRFVLFKQSAAVLALNAISYFVGASIIERTAHADIKSGTGSYIGNVFIVDCTKSGASFCQC